MPQTILITGANGEIGHGLVQRLAELGPNRIAALDLLPAQERFSTMKLNLDNYT